MIKGRMTPTKDATLSRSNAAGSAEAAIRAEYENSPEYRLGCEMLDALTGELGLDTETAAAMLGASAMPAGIELLGNRAAQTLEQMDRDGLLKRSPEEYLEDGNFIKLLREVPAHIAVRLADAELGEKNAKSSVESEKETARREVLEKLRTRRALPNQMRAGLTASAEPDFANMSSQEFARFKREHFGHK